jgi:hypothetical protein
MNAIELIRAHAKAGQRYAQALAAFRDAYVELHAPERCAANSNVAVQLSGTFPNGSLIDPRQFQHPQLVPLEPWDSWKIAIEARAEELVSAFTKGTVK